MSKGSPRIRQLVTRDKHYPILEIGPLLWDQEVYQVRLIDVLGDPHSLGFLRREKYHEHLVNDTVKEMVDHLVEEFHRMRRK